MLFDRALVVAAEGGSSVKKLSIGPTPRADHPLAMGIKRWGSPCWGGLPQYLTTGGNGCCPPPPPASDHALARYKANSLAIWQQAGEAGIGWQCGHPMHGSAPFGAVILTCCNPSELILYPSSSHCSINCQTEWCSRECSRPSFVCLP